ncbi:MAG: DNA-processing protein DprA [Candidatus Omnitrophota bacterium]
MSIEEKEILAFLALNRLRIEGRRRVLALLSEGKSAQEVVKRMESEDLLKDFSAPENVAPFNAEKEIELCVQKGIDFLLYSDGDYPAMLKEVADPPLLLYRKGTLIENDRNAIAIVGTRHPSIYGRTQAKRFAQELAARGLTIISGLARGIDQVAHDGALHISYGRTIAVMGCGLDVIYPKENENLFQRILERGAILSEYPLGMPPLPENFPRRNRILSGLSYATFVVEAHSRSGSLITAHQAVEQGREVFALPGPVDQLTSRGAHQLIKEGACLVETFEDILLALADRLKWENKFEPASQTPIEESSTATPEEKTKTGDSPHSFHSERSGSNTDSVAAERRLGPFKLPLGKEMKSLGGDRGSPDYHKEKENKSQESHLFRQRKNSSNDLWRIGDTHMEDEPVILELLKDEGPLGPDEMMEFTGLESAKLPVILLRMELDGKIKRGSDGKYHSR